MTIARGIKTPIIRSGDNLVEIIANSIFEDMKKNNYNLNNKDVIGITESIVSIANNNYATIDNIKDDINNKFKGDDLGIVFPILSRNRFSILLKAFAKAKKNITILLSFPFDEVGNPIMDKKIDKDFLTEKDYYKEFSNFVHPWTKVNMVDYYKKVCTDEGANVNIIFSNNALDILKYTENVLISSIHNRFEVKKLFDHGNALTLDQILNKSVNGSGFNSNYGLLGSNLATKDKVKLFPHENNLLLESIQKVIKDKTNKNVEVLIYGDGAFKDPVSGIWELADPVVSPSYTKGLEGSPNEVKLKYLVEDKFKDLNSDELEVAINEFKRSKDLDLKLGTTPRRYVDLLGSLCDLISGSGDKGTPVVLVQNYFSDGND